MFRVAAEEIQDSMWDEVFPLLDQHFFQVGINFYLAMYV